MTSASFGAELITALPLSVPANHWFQLLLYQGNEVVPGSGGQDIYPAEIRLETGRRAAATGRRAIHRTAAAQAAPPCAQIRLTPPFHKLAIGITGSLKLDVWDFCRCFSLNIFWRDQMIPFYLKKQLMNVYWDCRGHFQVPLIIG
ncbi:MAG: hypothetical protein LBL26_04215 [Peptococcaceae bacterium]|nr:hypothetical protein [Peptococcaceae bacterium]